MGVQKFSDGMIERLKPAADAKGYTVRDSLTRGLLIKVGMSKKTFRLQRKIGIVTKSFALGEFPHVKVTDARKKAEDIIGRKARGENLVGMIGSKATVETAADKWFAALEREGRSPKTLKTYRSVIRNLPPEWRAKPLRALADNLEEMADLHDAITEKRGEKIANLTCTVLKALYNWSRKKLPSAQLPPVDVTSAITRHREPPLERAMPFSAFSTWAREVDTIAQKWPTWAAFYRTMLLTGSRPRALRLLTWADVDAERRTIHFAEAKGRVDTKGYTVPTSPEIEEQLQLAKASDTMLPRSRFVFPRAYEDAPLAENVPHSHVGILSYHGTELRHAYRTLGDELGIGNELLMLLMGHSVPGIGQRYSNRKLLAHEGTAMREAQCKISRRMVELMAAPEMVRGAAALVPEIDAHALALSGP